MHPTYSRRNLGSFSTWSGSKIRTTVLYHATVNRISIICSVPKHVRIASQVASSTVPARVASVAKRITARSRASNSGEFFKVWQGLEMYTRNAGFQRRVPVMVELVIAFGDEAHGQYCELAATLVDRRAVTQLIGQRQNAIGELGYVQQRPPDIANPAARGLDPLGDQTGVGLQCIWIYQRNPGHVLVPRCCC